MPGIRPTNNKVQTFNAVLISSLLSILRQMLIVMGIHHANGIKAKAIDTVQRIKNTFIIIFIVSLSFFDFFLTSILFCGIFIHNETYKNIVEKQKNEQQSLLLQQPLQRFPILP